MIKLADPISGFTSGALGFASGAISFLYWGFILLIVAAVGAFLIYRMSFNCKIRIRYLTNGTEQISDKRCKIVKDNAGVEKLVISMGLWKTTPMPSPPPEATNIDLKGKRCFEVEFSDDGNKRYIIKERSTNKFVPLNTNDRVFYVNEEDKRLARHQKGLSDLISQAIPYIALIVILALVIFGWGDMVKPFNEEARAQRAYQLEWMKEARSITSMLKEVIKKEQVISGEAEIIRPANETGVPD